MSETLPSSLVARYPFVPAAKTLLESVGVQTIGYDEIARAQQRILDAVKQNPISSEQPPATYALSRLLLCVIDSDHAWSLFSKGEALAATTLLRSESPSTRLQVGQALFPTLQSEGEDSSLRYSISLTDYLSHGGQLVHTQLDAGKVWLTEEQFYSLFKRAVARRVRSPVRVSPQHLPPLFKEAAEELRARLPSPPTRETYKGHYLSLPCVKNAIEGTAEGKRYYASLSIAIACQKDGLSRAQAEQVMQTFVNNAKKATHDFTLREALATLDWVYRRSMHFSCKMQRAHGLAPSHLCGPPCPLEKAGAFKRGSPILLTHA